MKVAFTDFWPGFDPDTEWFVKVLRTRFTIDVTDQPSETDLVVAATFGRDHLRFRCPRVFICWENQAWPRSRFDWAFTCDYNSHPRHHRLPLWVVHLDLHPEHIPADPAAELAKKTQFAATVVSSPTGVVRNRLHEMLDRYKPVASGGRFRNNVGGPVADKMEFIRTAKFAFACEGSSHSGYTTEKIIHALAADTVPIYWGNPRIAEEFNPRRFVNYHEFASEQALVDRIIEIDNDDDLYRAMLSEPWFPAGARPPAADKAALLDQFQRIVSWSGTPVAQRSRLRNGLPAIVDRYRARQRFRERNSAG